MSIRSFIRGEFRRLGRKDFTPDYEACLMASMYKSGELKVELEKAEITVDARCGFDPDFEHSFYADVIYNADNWSHSANLEKEIERQENKRFARLAAEKSTKSMSIGDRTGRHVSHLRGRGRKQAERYYTRN